MSYRNFTLLISCMICGVFVVKSQKNNYEGKIDSLLKLMTIEEKIGQMNLYNGFWEVTGPVPADADKQKKYDHLKSGMVGAMLNIHGTENVRKIQELVMQNSRLRIPLLFGYDVVHGYKTIMPIPLAESSSWDLDIIERSARIAAIESAAVGLNWTYAPMVDISRDARWGRVMEGAGEDTYLGSLIAAARVKGLQGDNMSAPNTIAACVKHFAGYGFSESGRDYNTVDVGTSTLYNVVLPPFKAAVDAGARSFMNSFNDINGIPSTANKFLVNDILKKKWQFDGFVVSDWGSIGEMTVSGYASNNRQAALAAAQGPCDMDMETFAYTDYLKDLVEKNEIDVAYIDDAVRRVLRVKFELGLFDDPYRYCDANKEKTLIHHKDHHDVALEAAKKSIVLLKNDDETLPLKKSGLKIAVIGQLAADKDSPLGSWRAAADSSSAVSVLEGLRKYKDNKIVYEKGADVYTGNPSFYYDVNINKTDKSGFKKAIDAAKKSDVVIMVLGEHGFQTGEARSLTEIGLPGAQQELLEKVYEVNKNIVLVLMNGRPLTINWAAEKIPAIVEAWHLGSESGNAIAQVLYGDFNPSGKLTMSFPRSVGQIPIYYNQKNTGRPTPTGMVFWSHYNDESNEPLFPFGYGLGYSTFDYSDFKVEQTAPRKIQVSVKVQNTGKYEGEEIVQLYIRDHHASVIRPIKELKDFEKVTIKKGEMKTVSFTITEKDLSFFDNDGNFIFEPGDFDIMVGPSSANLQTTKLTVL